MARRTRRSSGRSLVRSDESIHQVLEHLLTTALGRRGFALGEDVLGEAVETGFPAFDFSADPTVPAGIAFLYEAIEGAILTNRSGDLEASSECIHAADMSMDQIDGLEALTSHLGVEVDSAGTESAVLENDEHGLGGEIQIGRELIGVPAQKQIARVSVDGAEHALMPGVIELMHHGVSGERRVIGLDVELESLHETVGSQEVDTGGGITVVLMLGGLFGLGFDQEGALEPNLLCMVHG